MKQEPYKIEKNIPKTRGKGNKTYPFDEMEVGDSFLINVPADRKLNTMQAQTLSAALSYASHDGNGKKFTTRRQSDTSFRIWRVK